MLIDGMKALAAKSTLVWMDDFDFGIMASKAFFSYVDNEPSL